jgi:non-ribosomal peptide synthetase component E (peptide arylation enzyme)
VIPAAGRAVDGPVLRAHLSVTLPAYMVPTRFVAISKVPLTTNGKLDTRALQRLL